ncbi:MAG: hypothetical protein A2381_10400 [Bdellovibrionales bacterium RIFOXYB1_FULL_37_110]|nr:MAG: hypothetical protein A2417_05720 [Bdellovibrionales bacterium RIFOXYC1_FULL_37_79]OFZ61173.1 MAG: hypothetical protein A2381_10400 [Bdellovibrionales bacterium RIFOXYB1_FULL_37_110]OFZ65501.1 MAG: hypothetical protein A2577_01820 [Bdellovibrionales bacterium RIFOXYD1_FULL_36_51]
MQTERSSFIVILGISDNEDRYSFKAYQRLLENGYHHLAGVSPKDLNLSNIKIVKTLSDIQQPIHTLTLYVSSEKLSELTEQIIKAAPKRIIFNPGTENEALLKQAAANNIETIQGCTLVLLSTDQF